MATWGTTLLILLGAFAAALALNAFVVPLPPTWAVLALIHGATAAPLLPLALAGALGAAAGRGCFALAVRHLNTHLPGRMRANAEALAAAAQRHARWPLLFVAVYSFLPLPTNPLFAGVGMGALPLRKSIVGYFAARWAQTTLLLLGTRPVARDVRALFAHSLTWVSATTAAIIVAYAIFLSLPWQRWLGIATPDRP